MDEMTNLSEKLKVQGLKWQKLKILTMKMTIHTSMCIFTFKKKKKKKKIRFTKLPLRISILQWAIKDHGLQ